MRKVLIQRASLAAMLRRTKQLCYPHELGAEGARMDDEFAEEMVSRLKPEFVQLAGTEVSLEGLRRLAGAYPHIRIAPKNRNTDRPLQSLSAPMDHQEVIEIVNSYASLIKEDFGPETPMGSKAHAIEEAGTRAVELTRKLLAFSRKQVLQTQIIPIDELVRSSEQMLRISAGGSTIRMTRVPICRYLKF